ncbi:MAG: hypothetical protein WC058_15865 [Phycisphaeraceae bacterium]
MYSNANAVFRADLSGYVMETQDWEKNLIADLAMPVINVDADAGQYPVFKKTNGQLLKRGVKARAPNSGFPRGTMAYEQDTYSTTEWGFEQAIDDTIAKRVKRFFDAEVIASSMARRKLLLDREIRVAAALFNTSNFTATNSATAYTAANLATFDFAADVEGLKDAAISTGESFNSIVIPYQVWTRIKQSTKFQNRLRGAGMSTDSILNVSAEAAAEVLELENVWVAKSAYDTAGEGATFTSGLIWANTYCWVGKVTSAGTPAAMLQGGAGYTLNWSEFGPPVGISTYRDEPNKSDVVRAEQNVAEKIVNAAAGALLTTQYS